jgi:glycosyltransferase involved in cell wall biosynthesis
LIPENLKVVALLPALNEEMTIGYVVRGALGYVDHVVVVDDLSEDNTADVARRAGAQVITLRRRRRVGGVVKAGISYVRTLKPDILVILDGDGQHDPHDIPKLVNAVLEGRGDWVIGSRYLYNLNNHVSSRRFSNWFFRQKKFIFLKGLGNWFFSKLVTVLTRQNITDTMSGFKALRWGPLLNLHLKFDYAYCPEMAITLCLEGYKVSEVPVQNRARITGESKVVKNILPYGIKQIGIVFCTYFRMNLGKIFARACI